LPELKWFLVGIGMPIVFGLMTYVSLGIFTNNWISLSDIGLNVKVPTNSALVVWITWLFFFGFGEESGWRGLLFPELNKKYNGLVSAMLAWLVKQSKWNLWSVIFWHGTFNLFTAGDRVGYSFAAIVSTLVMVVVVGIVWKYGKDLVIKEN
jgi:membrane protease YdiL (CAAX protease family)